MSMVEVRVHVPVERETEFYRWFADWRDGKVSGIDEADDRPMEVALEPAIAWWKSLTTKEAAIWSLWISAAPSMVTADAIVDALKLGGPREIPGALAWSGRKGRRVGFDVNWQFRTEPTTGKPIYGLEDVEYAAVLAQARDAADLSAPRVTAR
ncbi:hypothetical protein [Microbacterium candidum]|uniref:Uncharacterized protein n=1 Tax=Microbacterium candidum TaxID=3041922 RepID=A0ABT7MVY1_9MICO|nr:hypothetical protein [Microbacterium sp. ASV49]MDL9978612.1 hypothetical protein [Microbacterium sp. ASV49]